MFTRLQTKEMYQKALEEDATVFDYDGVYDQMKQDDKVCAEYICPPLHVTS